MRIPRLPGWWVTALLLCGLLVACGSRTPVKIVLIGGAQSEAAGRHDHPVGNIPPRHVIAAHPLPRIVDALSNGAMRVQATGLTPAEIQAVGRHLKTQ